MMMSGRNRSPFTASQWQELEHQALIFKYIVSGVPIPPDLICTVKRSLVDSSLSSRLFPHQQQPIGWGCFQMGFGRKADPEPGRCRRTDGKKWRCSKEAYPDSKYCERHMHRGKNRSRKPVEVVSATSPSPTTISSITTTTTTTTPTNSYSHSLSPLSSSSSETPHHSHPHPHPHHHSYQYHHSNTPLYPFLYPHPSSSRPPGSCLSPQPNNTHHLFLESGSYSEADRYYRHHHHGMREGVDERAFFPEASGTVRGLHDSYTTPLTMSSSKGYSEFQYQNLADNIPKQHQQQEQQEEQQHCFVLGTDFKSLRPIKVERDDHESQKPLHHFFGEWPLKSRDSWLDLEEDPPTHHHHNASFSTTQLSISIPMSSQKLLASESRIQTDG